MPTYDRSFVLSPFYANIIREHISLLVNLHAYLKDKSVFTHNQMNINVALISWCAVYFEGFLKAVLQAFVGFHENNKKTKEFKIIEAAAWGQLKIIFLLTGTSLERLIGGKVKDINLIFQLRNAIDHSNQDSFFMEHDDSGKPQNIVDSNYNVFWQKLFQRRLVQKRDPGLAVNYQEIFSDAVAKWVRCTVKELSIQILNEVERLPLATENIKGNLNIVKDNILTFPC